MKRNPELTQAEKVRQLVLQHTHPLAEAEIQSLKNWAKESLEFMRSGRKSKNAQKD